MPSYISHTIMARDVYNKLNKKNINLEYMLTYSLGGDLTKGAKCRYDSHNKKRDEFFKTICDYIKEKSLENDPEVLGLLYGHICHYALDDLAHPLVRKLAKTCSPNKNNHYFVEDYYDLYLVNKKYKLSFKKYNNKKILKAKVTKNIKNILDYAYEKIYNEKHVSKYYKLNIFLYNKLRYIYLTIGEKLFNKLRGFNKFLEKNKDIDLFNNNHKISFKDINNKEKNDNFDTLYEESIKKALKDIKEINKLLGI